MSTPTPRLCNCGYCEFQHTQRFPDGAWIKHSFYGCAVGTEREPVCRCGAHRLPWGINSRSDGMTTGTTFVGLDRHENDECKVGGQIFKLAEQQEVVGTRCHCGSTSLLQPEEMVRTDSETHTLAKCCSIERSPVLLAVLRGLDEPDTVKKSRFDTPGRTWNEHLGDKGRRIDELGPVIERFGCLTRFTSRKGIAAVKAYVHPRDRKDPVDNIWGDDVCEDV